MGMIIELFVLLLAGISFIIVGFLIWKKQMVSLIHSYHYKNVKPRDKKAYTKLMGIALIIMGLLSIMAGIVNAVFNTQAGWILFCLGMVTGLFMINKAQKKYNGSWFS